MNGKERAPSRGTESELGRPTTSPAHRFSLPSFYFLLCTIFSSSCTSPTPPPPPPPPGADTTSHDFIWEIDTLGYASWSVLNDVEIIDDTTVWVVGEMFVKDSTGQVDHTAYGLAKWNGRMWKHERLSATAPQGYLSNLVPRGIFAISANEVWFAAGGVHRLRGGVLTSYWINQFPGNPRPIWLEGQYAQRLWASSSSNVYAVGTQGAIARFDGTTWIRIESGTTLPVNDIWGSSVDNSSSLVILAVAADRYQNIDKRLLRISSTGTEVLPDSGLTWSLSGVWFAPGSLYYVVGAGIYSHPNLTTDLRWHVRPSGEINSYYSYAIRGNAANDFVVAGAFGEILHFNGSTWRNYINDIGMLSGNFYSVSERKDIVVAVGDHGIVAIGRR